MSLANDAKQDGITRAAGEGADDDEDTISITSTQSGDEDPEREYGVEDIWDKRITQTDGTLYFVKWEGYPPYRNTWEPAEQLTDEIINDMFLSKFKDPGFRPYPNMQVHLADRLAKNQRHRRRNAKRQRLGLPQTEPSEEEMQIQEADAVGIANDAFGAPEHDSQVAKKNTSSHGTKVSEADFLASIQDASTDGDASDDDDVVFMGSVESARKKEKKKAKSKQKEKGKRPETTRPGKETNRDKSKEKSKERSKERSKDKLKEKSKEKSKDKTRDETKDRPGQTNDIDKSKSTPSSTPTTKPSSPVKDASKGPGRTVSNGSSKAAATTSNTNSNQPTPRPEPLQKSIKKLIRIRKSGPRDAVGNAFTGGREVRRSYTLETAMTDPNRPSMMFRNLHTRRMAEKREREKADRPPDQEAIMPKLFPITSGPPPSLPSPGAGSPPAAVFAATPLTTTASTPDSNGEVAAVKKPKKRKTVRFSAPEDDETSPKSSTQNQPTPDDSMFVEMVAPEPVFGDVTKTVVLGRSTPLQAVFRSVPQNGSPSTELSSFLAEEMLCFAHTCFGETLQQQFKSLCHEVMFNGVITAPTGLDNAAITTRLEAASERLRLTGSGLFVSRSTYGVILYPARCDSWKEEYFGFQPPKENVDAGLRYVFFSTVFDYQPFLRQPGQDSSSLVVAEGQSARVKLMQDFFDLTPASYNQLFPDHEDKPNVRRTVYLAFPPPACEMLKVISLWIRSLDPQCEIFFASRSGSWSAFRHRITKDEGKEDIGVVLVHELSTGDIVRFPGLRSLLDKGCTFWSLSQSILEPKIYPSVSWCPSRSPPGQMSLTRLFSNGLAVLVTPSFLVSEPYRASELLKWMADVQGACLGSDIRVKLVGGWNLCKYLQNLAYEKAMLRDAVMDGHAWDDDRDREAKAKEKGVLTKDCKYHYLAWKMANRLVKFYEELEPELAGDESLPLVYADRAIDVNDEQSLVNWFAAWSTLRLDQYRSFFVVGSSAKTLELAPQRAQRFVRIPTYLAGSVGELGDRAAARGGEGGVPSDVSAAGSPVAMAEKNKKTSFSESTSPNHSNHSKSLKSSRFPTDSPEALGDYLFKWMHQKMFKCYTLPVFWMDEAEARHYGSDGGGRLTMWQWFDFSWTFLARGGGLLRTWAGFFYTPDEEALPSGHVPRGRKLPRHPWIGIYRPENPNVTPFKTTELIIWDVRSKQRLHELPEVRKQHLTSAQQRLVELVLAESPRKNEGMPLRNVWVGGSLRLPQGEDKVMQRSPPPDEMPTNELDATAKFMDSLMDNPRDTLPPTNHYLHLSGFRKLVPDSWRECNDSPMEDVNAFVGRNDGTDNRNGNGNKNGKENEDEDEDAKLPKMVFHPPVNPTHTGESKCRNRLFDFAKEIRARDAKAKTMAFQYRPTTKWYREQVEEDRGYEHLRVVGWEDFFKRMHIGETR